MASDAETLAYVREQMRGVRGLTSRKMFGEYSLYVGEKVVALIADNQLFIKVTEAGRAFIGNPIEAPPYPGARNYFLVDEQLDDAAFISELVRVTEREVPMPKPKKKAGAPNKAEANKVTPKKAATKKNAAPIKAAAKKKTAPNKAAAKKKTAPKKKR